MILHTSTSAMKSVFGLDNHLKPDDWPTDPRLVVLTFEGAGGDPRVGLEKQGGLLNEWTSLASRYYVPGPRTVVVPYYVEPRAHITEALVRSCTLPASPMAQAARMTGRGGRVYFRASGGKGEDARRRLAAAFSNDSTADVVVHRMRVHGGHFH